MVGIRQPAPPLGSALQALLRNESDVAYKRRVRYMLDFLDLDSAGSLLDCGCGMGFYLYAASELYPHVALYGVDAEPDVLGQAARYLEGRTALAARSDISALPFASASVDRVLMSEVLEHVQDPGPVLAEVGRVLKPGGILALTVPPQNYSFWFDPLNWVLEHLGSRPIRRGPFAGIWANHRRLYARDELLEVVGQAGFSIERYEELTHYCFPGTQFLVYTIGKSLVTHRLLPDFVSRSADRFRGQDNAGSGWNPMNWILGFFNWFDRLNEDPRRMAARETFVNLAIKARKV